MVTFSSAFSVENANTSITPGSIWLATNSVAINAHGGCVIPYNNTYYWFGEDRTKFVSNGVSCYKSTDLLNWTKVGIVFAHSGSAREDLNDFSAGRLMERPKVIYNDSTKKWVMWGHWEKNESDYGAARVCVAFSDNIEGPYTFYKTFRPNTHDSRDQSIFKDTDGKAYHICSTDMNSNMNLSMMTDNYLEPSLTETKVLLGKRYEAPALFKLGAIYFGLFSNCTGWDPNPGQTAYTMDLMGDWSDAANFCVDDLKEVTYKSQSTYVFKVNGYENAYVYMGDRWNSSNAESSTYVWLPLSMRSGYPTVRNYSSWNMSVFNDCDRYKRAKSIVLGNTYQLLEKTSNRMVSKTGTSPIVGFAITNDSSINMKFQFIPTSTPFIYKIKDVTSGKYFENVFGSLRLGAESSSLTQQWCLLLKEDGYYNIVNQFVGTDGLKKVISISGSNTFNASNLYLDKLNTSLMQDFAIYFDSKTYSYEAADLFSKKYLEDNKATMLEQDRIMVIRSMKRISNGFQIYQTKSNGTISVRSAGNNSSGNLLIEVNQAQSGQKMFSKTVYFDGRSVELNVSDLYQGMYIVKVQSDNQVYVQKIIVY